MIMNAKLSDEDIAELLNDPSKWLKKLEGNKERALYDQWFNHNNKIHDIHAYYRELELLANEQLAKFDTLSGE